MNEQNHYTGEQLKEFLKPDFATENPEQEADILEHFMTCEPCKNLANEIKERGWDEIRSEFKGFK
jgi:chorismate mutase